jgi:hypothetical protein
VHVKDWDDRVCYRTVPEPAEQDYFCLANLEEVGPYKSLQVDCQGDGELADDLVWCLRSHLRDEFELRYGEKEAFLPLMIGLANQNGLNEPQPADVGNPDARCFRQSSGQDSWIVCWYERIDPRFYGGISPCERGYAGSFWCRYGQDTNGVDTPVPGPTWTWSWTDPRD